MGSSISFLVLDLPNGLKGGQKSLRQDHGAGVVPQEYMHIAASGGPDQMPVLAGQRPRDAGAAYAPGGPQNLAAPGRVSNCAAEFGGVPPEMKMLLRVSGRGAEFYGGPPDFVTAQRVLQRAAEFDGGPHNFDLRQRV